MVFTIITSIVLVIMALILGAFAWKMRQQERFINELIASGRDDVELLHLTNDELVAARAQIEELEFQLHIKDSDIRIEQSQTALERRNKQEVQQLLEIHRMQSHSTQDSAALLALAEDMRTSHAKPQLHLVPDETNRGDVWAAKPEPTLTPDRGNVVDFWAGRG